MEGSGTMKILGMTGSPRGAKSMTLRLVEAVLDGAKAAGAEVECVDVCTLKIKYCTACGTCYAKGTCPHQDDFRPLYDRMLAADGLVWGSPDYFRGVTAQMKTVIDRMADTVHCQFFTGKYGCAVSTSGGPEFAEVTGYLNNLLVGFGASAVGAVGASASMPGAMETAAKAARELGGTLAEAIRTRRAFPEQAAVHTATRERFKRLVTMNKSVWKHEYEHWQKMGWL
jgi:multimeric flavodoxin WrbA